MGYFTQRISQFRGINRSIEPNGLDVSYAYDAINVDISGGKLTNKIGSVRLVSAEDVPAGRPFIYPTNNGDYLVFRDKYIAMGLGYNKHPYTLLGDANCDGEVGADDASLIMRYVAGLSDITPEGLLNADVNFDGVVNNDDADAILLSIVHLIDIDPKWDDPEESEVGPYEPDRFGTLVRPVQNVVNDTSLAIRGVGRNKISARINNIDCIILSGMLGTGSGYYTYRGYLSDGDDAKTAVYYLGNETVPKIHVRQFGSGLYLFKDVSVLSTDADSDGVLTSITIDIPYANLTDEMKTRLVLDGVYLFKSAIGSSVDEEDINNAYMWLKVTSVENGASDNSQLNVSTTSLATDVESGSYAYLRGGCSDITITYMVMHYGRMFAAGHRNNDDHPRRLYWSCLPGDGRTIEDWTFSDASIDTSGGHVDIGDPSDKEITGLVTCNHQLLIFTKYRLFRLYGTAPSNYTLELVGELEGTRISNPVEVNGAIYWLSLSGVQCYNGSYVQHMDDNYSTRRLLESFPRYMREAFDTMTVHADLFDNSLMFAFDNNRGMDDSCMVLRYELETGNVIKYVIPCANYLQQFTDSWKTNFGKVNGNVLKNETRYFQALVHDDGTMTMTQWYGWGRQPFGWYDNQPVESVWDTGWTDMGSPEADKKPQTVCARGSGSFRLILESEVNRDHIRVDMPEENTRVKDISPRFASGRTIRIVIESDELFEIEPYMTIKYDTGASR